MLIGSYPSGGRTPESADLGMTDAEGKLAKAKLAHQINKIINHINELNPSHEGEEKDKYVWTRVDPPVSMEWIMSVAKYIQGERDKATSQFSGIQFTEPS